MLAAGFVVLIGFPLPIDILVSFCLAFCAWQLGRGIVTIEYNDEKALKHICVKT